LRTQEAAMTALGRYQATYRAVPIGLLSFDRDNRIERYNEVAVRLFDVRAGSIDPHRAPGARADASPLAGDSASLDRAHVDTLSALNDAFPQDLAERIHQELENFEEADFVWRLEKVSGHRWLRVQAQKTDTGHDVSLTDITALKQAEHHLIHESQHDRRPAR
jgi:hypothetical protein